MPYAIVTSKKRRLFKTIKSEQVLDEVNIELPEFSEKHNKKYAKKLCKVLKKYNVSNIVLDNDLQNKIEFKNTLYENNNYIIAGKRLYKVLVNKLIEDIVSYMNIEAKDITISILTNEYSIENLDMIETVSEIVKSISIITDNIVRFEKFAEILMEKNGTAIKVCEKNKANMQKSCFIINLDFNDDIVSKMRIPRECILLSIDEKITSLKKSFNGIIINDIDIYLNKEIKNIRTLSLCEAYIYNYLKKIKENQRIFDKSGYKINGYYGNNGKIEEQDFKRVGKLLKSGNKKNK